MAILADTKDSDARFRLQQVELAATAAIKAGDMQRAKPLLISLTALNPKHAAGLFYLGEIYRQENLRHAAQCSYEASIKADAGGSMSAKARAAIKKLEERPTQGPPTVSAMDDDFADIIDALVEKLKVNILSQLQRGSQIVVGENFMDIDLSEGDRRPGFELSAKRWIPAMNATACGELSFVHEATTTDKQLHRLSGRYTAMTNFDPSSGIWIAYHQFTFELARADRHIIWADLFEVSKAMRGNSR